MAKINKNLVSAAGTLTPKTDGKTGRNYVMTAAGNGFNFVQPLKDHGAMPILHLPAGNTKMGTDHVLSFGLPIGASCVRTCECFTKKICYGMSGNYVQYPINQLYLADNMLFFKVNGWDKTADAIIAEIKRTHCKYFRWFTVGDIPNVDFLKMMIKVGKNCPGVKFWGYTKKYMIVNHYIDKYMHGNAELFHQYTGLIFSHWRNKNGSFFKMLNPYNMPLSVFVPLGMEKEAEKANHICPCSNPDVYENCCNCSNPCYELKPGETMALLEHSTPETAKRDREIKKAHDAIKAGTSKPVKNSRKTGKK